MGEHGGDDAAAVHTYQSQRSKYPVVCVYVCEYRVNASTNEKETGSGVGNEGMWYTGVYIYPGVGINFRFVVKKKEKKKKTAHRLFDDHHVLLHTFNSFYRRDVRKSERARACV